MIHEMNKISRLKDGFLQIFYGTKSLINSDGTISLMSYMNYTNLLAGW